MVVEDGSELAAELWATRRPAASSVLSNPEGCAALAAARRAKRLNATQHDDARTTFESLQRELLLIGVDSALARQAGRLAGECGLRGYDAVHLATALAVGAPTTLVTWDRDLRRAAAERGCAVAPPG